MSVLVKGMEMPENCYDCPLEGSMGVCLATDREDCRVESLDRPEWCPLVPAVPLEDYQSMERTVHKLTQALAAAGTPVEEYDSDHIWYNGKQFISLRRVGEMIKEKTADATPVRHGRWIKNDNGTYSCSECQSWIPNEQHHYARYCLHCGAKMDEEAQP